VRGRRKALSLCLAGLALAGCGGGEGRVDRVSLSGCLAQRGWQVRAAAPAGGTILGDVAPDFRARLRGETADVVVERSDARARRDAANLSGALGSYGVREPGRRLIARRNVVVIFERHPSAGARRAVTACLG
jgi:hypothetical protein